MMMPKSLTSKITDCNNLLQQRLSDLLAKKLAAERNLTRLQSDYENIKIIENTSLGPYQALLKCYDILHRIKNCHDYDLGLDPLQLNTLQKDVEAKILSLEDQLKNSPQTQVLVPDFQEKVHAIQSVIKHTEKLEIDQLTNMQLAELSKLLNDHVKLCKNLKKELPILTHLKARNILSSSSDSSADNSSDNLILPTISELQAYEVRLNGLKSQIILPPMLMITSPDGEQIMPALWKIEGMNEKLVDDIGDWRKVLKENEIFVIHRNSTANVSDTRSLLLEIENSLQFKPSISNLNSTSQLMVDLSQQLDDLTLVSQPVLFKFSKPILWKGLQNEIETLRSRVTLFEQKLEKLPEPPIKIELDPSKNPHFLLDSLRQRWLSIDYSSLKNTSSPIEYMMQDVNSMIEEGEYIEGLLQNTSAISRLPLLDKHFRLLNLMKKFRHKLQKTQKSLRSSTEIDREYDPNYSTYEEFTKVVKNLTGTESIFSLPLKSETIAELEVKVTQFKLEYNHFVELYQKLLETDFYSQNAESGSFQVDHINISNDLLEKYTQIIEAYDDISQLAKRTKGKSQNARSKLGKNQFLREIFEGLQATILCDELNQIFG